MDDETDNYMKSLLEEFVSEGNVTDMLLDYMTVNKSLYKAYLDAAMPACSVSTFKDKMMNESEKNFQNLVTTQEEAFALLVLENNIERWSHYAEDREDQEPPAKYQKKIGQRKDKKSSVGDWTSEGMTRFNEIYELVRAAREDERRKDFDEAIKQMYIAESDNQSSDEMERQPKRRRGMDGVAEKYHGNTVTALDTFDPSTLVAL